MKAGYILSFVSVYHKEHPFIVLHTLWINLNLRNARQLAVFYNYDDKFDRFVQHNQQTRKYGLGTVLGREKGRCFHGPCSKGILQFMFRFEPYMTRRRVKSNTYLSCVSLLIFVHTMGLNVLVFNTHTHPISCIVTVNHALYFNGTPIPSDCHCF